MKPITDRIIKDIKAYYIPGIAIFLYMAFMEIFFRGVCPLVLVTGFPCPGCGMTRAATLFFTGRFEEAFVMHPFFYVLLLLAAAYGISHYILVKNTRFLKKYAVICLLAMIGFYSYRMVFWFPNREPMLYHYGSLLGKILVK